ncbi:hypothetical protein HZU75_11670 [Chitinibacter fontanus]|uniref:Uncharacterized protein n=1 Tax=Chitinibacter fontanus TaxID=1737446 RepID=A0A7D5ZKT8_9NEIS|nr:hypothetical protein [Chitinibacter fontanus]QLI82130.1 hypothetical protein HZU75_11670 [Chitinibacter fontanus]
MHNLTKATLLVAGLALAAQAPAAPLQIETTLALGQTLEGQGSVKQTGDQARVKVQGQTIDIRGLAAPLHLPRQRVQVQLLRQAHPLGPQTRLSLTQGEQHWLLASALSSGSSLAAGRQLIWREGQVQLSNGLGQISAIPADGDLGVQAAWRECLRVLDVRVPAVESSDSEPTFDVAYWNTRAKDCR